MQAHTVYPYTHPQPYEVKRLNNLKVVIVHIKSKGIEHRAPCKYIFCPNTHPRALGGVKRSKYFY